MNRHVMLLRQRRMLLQLTAESQRQTFAAIGARWRAPIALADAGILAVRSLRRHPVVAGLLLAVFVWASGGRIRRWSSLAIAVWQGYRTLTTGR